MPAPCLLIVVDVELGKKMFLMILWLGHAANVIFWVHLIKMFVSVRVRAYVFRAFAISGYTLYIRVFLRKYVREVIFVPHPIEPIYDRGKI